MSDSYSLKNSKVIDSANKPKPTPTPTSKPVSTSTPTSPITFSKLNEDAIDTIAQNLSVNGLVTLGRTNKAYKNVATKYIEKRAFKKIPTVRELERPEIQSVEYTFVDGERWIIFNNNAYFIKIGKNLIQHKKRNDFYYKDTRKFITTFEYSLLELKTPLINSTSAIQRDEFTHYNRYYSNNWKTHLSSLLENIIYQYTQEYNTDQSDVATHIKVNDTVFILENKSIYNEYDADDCYYLLTITIMTKSTKTRIEYKVMIERNPFKDGCPWTATKVIVDINGKDATYELRHYVDEIPENETGKDKVVYYKRTNHFSEVTMNRINLEMLVNIMSLVDSLSNNDNSLARPIEIKIGKKTGEMKDKTYTGLLRINNAANHIIKSSK